MIWKNTPARWGAVAKGFHWLTALLVVGLLCVGLYMTGLDFSPDKLKLYGLHKAFGITVLALVVLRIGWRVFTPRPGEIETHKGWEVRLAAVIHFFFYAALIAMPMTGWIMSSAASYPVSVFGLFTLPNIVGPDENAVDLMKDVHEFLAYILIAAIILHVAGALKHHVIDRDETLRRMIPFMSAEKEKCED